MPRPRSRSSIDLSGIPSATLQSHRPLADINQIVRRGVPPAPGPGQYADLVGRPDYLEAANTVARVSQGFARLPAKIRDYCDNRPENYLELLSLAESGEATDDELSLLKSVGISIPDIRDGEVSDPPTPGSTPPNASPEASTIPPAVKGSDPGVPPSRTPNDD